MRKIAIGLGIGLLLFACGKANVAREDIQAPEPCTVHDAPEGALITCPDGTSHFIRNGKDGASGANGADGAQGENGAQGIPGDVGQMGIAGTPGNDGYSVVIAQTASLTCANGGVTLFMATDLNRDGLINFDVNDGGLAVADICNGDDGTPAASSPFSTVGILDPCGATPGYFNEVFLKLANGQYVASFSDNANGKNTRLALLTDGNFVTTDGTSCYFTVSGAGTVISNEHR